MVMFCYIIQLIRKLRKVAAILKIQVKMAANQRTSEDKNLLTNFVMDSRPLRDN